MDMVETPLDKYKQLKNTKRSHLQEYIFLIENFKTLLSYLVVIIF